MVAIDNYNDNCPTLSGYSNGDCRDPVNNIEIGLYPEHFSSQSRCFVANLLPNHLKVYADDQTKRAMCLASQVERIYNKY
jgi:hypothetical protein